jgi:hypothetical protein
MLAVPCVSHCNPEKLVLTSFFSSFCGIIIHCADNSFKCHVFHCLPSCVQLCKNIEAACKVNKYGLNGNIYIYIYLFQLRYQKCLDAHPQAARQIETTKVSCLVICWFF